VNLYNQYKGRVQFVVINLDQKQSPAQEALVKKYFAGYIPHVVVLDRSGAAVYNSAGEVEESTIAPILDRALK
jgi:thioredoxin-like negative regulator of GroEL